MKENADLSWVDSSSSVLLVVVATSQEAEGWFSRLCDWQNLTLQKKEEKYMSYVKYVVEDIWVFSEDVRGGICKQKLVWTMDRWTERGLGPWTEGKHKRSFSDINIRMNKIQIQEAILSYDIAWKTCGSPSFCKREGSNHALDFPIKRPILRMGEPRSLVGFINEGDIRK